MFYLKSNEELYENTFLGSRGTFSFVTNAMTNLIYLLSISLMGEYKNIKVKQEI